MNWTDNYPDWGEVPKDADVPDACFAYVPEDGPPSARKLPYQFERDGTMYVHPTGTSLALSALGPNPPHGQAVAIPADQKVQVRAKLLAAKAFADKHQADEEQVKGDESVIDNKLAGLEAAVSGMEDGETKDKIQAEINKLSEQVNEQISATLSAAVTSLVGIATQLLASISTATTAMEAMAAADGACNTMYAIRDMIRANHPEVGEEAIPPAPGEPVANEAQPDGEPDGEASEPPEPGEPPVVPVPPEPVDQTVEIASESVKDGRAKVRIRGRVIGEAVGPEKDTYKVCLIESGTGRNGHCYPAAFLEANVEQYEGKRMFADHQLTDSEEGGQESQINPSVKDFVSSAQNVRFDPDYECLTTGSKGAIVGEAKIFNAAFKESMRYPEFRAGIGLSHCIYAVWDAAEEEGQSIQVATEMEVDSIDWVMNPAQGGRVLEHATQKGGVNVSGYEEKMKEIERKQLALETRASAQMIVESEVGLTPKLRSKVVERVMAVQEKSAEGIDVKVITEAAIADMRDTISEATGPAVPGVSSSHSIADFAGMSTNEFKNGAAKAMAETIFSI